MSKLSSARPGGQRGSVTSLHLEGTEDVIKLYRRRSDEGMILQKPTSLVHF